MKELCQSANKKCIVCKRNKKSFTVKGQATYVELKDPFSYVPFKLSFMPVAVHTI